MIAILALVCMLAGALYIAKLVKEWQETPITEPVKAGYGNWLLVLCLMAAVAVLML